jgi:hypothetical protein
MYLDSYSARRLNDSSDLTDLTLRHLSWFLMQLDVPTGSVEAAAGRAVQDIFSFGSGWQATDCC